MEENITFKEIIKRIKAKGLLFLILSLIIFLISILSIELIYNKNYQNYEVKFEYTTRELKDNTFPNGSIFDYRSIINIDSLNTVKKSNDLYSDIDVSEIANNNDIHIINENNTYTLTISNKYFKNRGIAKKFITDLIRYTVQRVSSKMVDNFDYITLYEAANSYDLKISYLEKQYKAILEELDIIESIYGKRKMLLKLRNDIEAFFDENTFNDLYNELKINGYIYDYEANKERLINQKNLLENEKELLSYKRSKIQEHINDLANIGFDNINIDSYTNSIIELSNQIIDIEAEIASIDLMLENNDNTIFEDKLFSYESKLIDYTNKVDDYRIHFFNEIDHIYYYDNIKLKGGINSVVGILISTTISLLASTIICISLYKSKYDKE